MSTSIIRKEVITMIIFTAHIVNVFTLEKRKIVFDVEQIEGMTEKDVYMQAMSTAYDKAYKLGCMWELSKLALDGSI